MSHAFRYILFAHQLLRDGKLSDLHAGCDIWTSLSADSHTSWQYYEDNYRPMYKKLLDEMPVSPEDKVPPPDEETLALPSKYHRLLYLVRLTKQQDSYHSGIMAELIELARRALAVRFEGHRPPQLGHRVIRANLPRYANIGLNLTEYSFASTLIVLSFPWSTHCFFVSAGLCTRAALF